MRNGVSSYRGNWAAYVRWCREEILMVSKAELGRRLGVDRGTVHRWEAGANRTEDAALVAQLAEISQRPLDEALVAAGLRPTAEPPPKPERPADPELDLIRQHPRLSAERKKQLIQWVLMRRAREEQARMEDLQQMVGDA